jgi:imidazolonepropionase-like amidohydrolase
MNIKGLRWLGMLLAIIVTSVAANELNIVNARLIDGNGSVPYLTSVEISQGVIVSIGGPALKNAVQIDARGLTVMPGLIDSHVHLQSIPGAVFRKDNEATRLELRKHHLSAYVASGVTTILDTAIASVALREVQQYLADGGAGPQVKALGPTFHTPGGYLDGDSLSDYWGPRWRASASINDVVALFNEYEGIADLVGVKVPITYRVHPFAFDRWPSHSPEMREVITAESRKRNKPIYVHATEQRTYEMALEMGAHAIVHLPFFNLQPPDDLVRKLKSRGVYVITTISTVDAVETLHHPSRLSEPHVKLTVPPLELETAGNEEAWDGFITTMTQSIYPWMPDWFARLYGYFIYSESMLQFGVERMMMVTRTFHEAGIPIVVGTDSGSWPHFLNLFHGPTTIREMELLVEAGMEPVDVIASATRIPAEMMGIEDETGTIEVGKRANLLILQGDPLLNISALKSILWVVKDGEARHPEDWLYTP